MKGNLYLQKEEHSYKILYLFFPGLPQIRKRNAVQYLITTPPPDDEGGIVTECCRKACSITDMESYCAASPGTFVANPTNAPLVRYYKNLP